jgi:triacylglycerol lipase
MNPPYPSFPLNNTTTRFDPQNALAMAYCSDLAYKDESTIQTQFKAWGFSTVAVINVKSTQFFVANKSSDSYTIIAFRGTRPDQLKDWLTDIEAQPIDFNQYFSVPDVGQTHFGFTYVLASVFPQILNTLRGLPQSGGTLWLGGHSLGGALAVIAGAALLYQERRPVNGIYTFGQPRVSTLNFSQNLESQLGTTIFRFVNNEDVVTRVPPRLPFCYDHVGQLCYFDAKGTLQNDEYWWNDFLTRVEVGAGGWAHITALLSQPIDDHDLDSGYIANINRYINDVKNKVRQPIQF